ncbi:uncharacterized protein LODBEIA_P42950 [Lodderomyces beijingensis]|uniref:Glutaredoxin domain-containing protein n=1 Tax=Lodderomyces beijingensis TaxID=1775926 RepID=A0ABP0ZSI9_9ASCO
MDFEERLETAERSESPSLVGASIRSADDSPHRNYIHPEKYQSSRSKSKTRHSKLNQAISASLDDLINEGALLNSDADFDEFLDSDGGVKKDAQYTTKKRDDQATKNEIEKALESKEPVRAKTARTAVNKDKLDRESAKKPTDNSIESSADSFSSTTATKPTAASQFYQQEDYSTPNLSEYQLDQDIKDHKDLLSHVQSYDLEKLPRSNLSLRQEDDNEQPRSRPSARSNQTLSTVQQQRLEGNLHTPVFHTDRARSRSRSANPTARAADRSSSRSSANSSRPHLARGDSYKNVHGEEPSKYELPPSFSTKEEQLKEEDEVEKKDGGDGSENDGGDGDGDDDDDDRRTRHSRPTMGESIAAAEAKKAAELKAIDEIKKRNPAFVSDFESNPVTRDPSLVTSGDYTNFEVDSPSTELPASDHLYAARSQSSTNYLRSISRSRSRARPLNNAQDEKNDANTDSLIEEGALVTDDPYASITQLDTMVNNVLQGKETPGVNFLPLTEETEKEVEAESTGTGNNSEKNHKKEEERKEKEKEKEEPVQEKSVTVKPSTDAKNTKPSSEKNPPKNASHASSKPESEKTTLESDTHEKPIDEDIERAKIHSNEKDDSNTDNLKAEGALVSDDPLENVEKVDEADLEKEGVTSGKDVSQQETESERKTETNSKGKTPKLEHTKKDPKENLLAASGDVDGPEDLEKMEEEAEGEKEINLESAEEAKGKIPADEKAELESAENNEKESESAAANHKVRTTEVTKDVKYDSEATTPSNDGDDGEQDDDLENLNVSPEEIRKHLESLPIYIFTSLAGGMQIMPRTNRLATILQANGIKFEYRDLGTDEAAKKIWKRQAEGKTLPGVVRGDDFIGNWQAIDEANEEYRLKDLLYENF